VLEGIVSDVGPICATVWEKRARLGNEKEGRREMALTHLLAKGSFSVALCNLQWRPGFRSALS